MDERPLERAWRTARAERAAQAGWEPPEGWESLLRRRRRTVLLGAAACLVVALVLPIGLRGLDRGEWGYAAVFLLSLLVPVVRMVLDVFPRRRRLRWEERIREQVRSEHARTHDGGAQPP